MKKMRLFLTATLCGSLLFSSCKKSGTESGGSFSSADLGAGKAAIQLNTSADYGGSTSFNQSNTIMTTAQSGAGSTLRTIQVTATELNGINTRTVQIGISVPASANTSAGNLVGDFSLPNNATILPSLVLTSTTGGAAGLTYAAESGTFTITKLTGAEIEGTFSAVVKATNSSETFSVSNGSFAGKFN